VANNPNLKPEQATMNWAGSHATNDRIATAFEDAFVGAAVG